MAATGGKSGPARRPIIEARNRAGDTVAWLMMVYLGVVAVCVVAMLSPDRLLLEGVGYVNVPFTGPVPLGPFVLWSAVVLISLRLFLGVYDGRRRKLDAMAPCEPTESGPFPRGRLTQRIARAVPMPVLYLLLPAMLGLFTWKAATPRTWGASPLLLLIVCVAIEVDHLLTFLNRGVRWLLILAMILVLYVTYFYFFSYYPYDPPYRELKLSRADFGRAEWVRLDLRDAGEGLAMPPRLAETGRGGGHGG